MAITSIGYPGPIGAPEWAQLAVSLGADYGVIGAGDCRVSTVPASDRTVKVAAGSAYGKGIFDVSSAEETIQLASIVSGSRWDLVGFLRTWDGEDSATTVAKITGTSSQTAVFGSRPSTAGASDFQPLALVQVTAGSSIPTAVIDLRVWQANGGAVANDALALQYLNGAGTEVWVGSDLWHRYVDGAGALQWAQQTPSFVIRDNANTVIPTAARAMFQSFPIETATTSVGVIDITFPVAFATPPIVTATTVTGTAVPVVIASGMVTTTGCRLYWPGVPSTFVRAHIHAVGWRP